MAQTENNNSLRVDRLPEAAEAAEAAAVLEKSTIRNGIDKENAAQAFLLLQNDPILSVTANNQMAINVPSSDKESGCEQTSPMLDCLKESGARQIFVRNTKFSEPEFMRLYEQVGRDLEIYLSTGRGKKLTLTTLDLFFMMLCFLKRGTSWEEMEFTFRLKKSHYEANINRLLSFCSDHLYEKLVKAVKSDFTMTSLRQLDFSFRHFKSTKYATNVRFQHGQRKTQTYEETKPYFSRKHQLHGMKAEVSVFPSGLCCCLSSHMPGSIADIAIFRRSLQWHKDALKKQEIELHLTDIDIQGEEYPDSWSVLVDKGYQGLQQELRAIHPVKEPPGGRISNEERMFNLKVSSDRVLVEQFFFARALTHWHIIHNSLSESDREKYEVYRNELYQKGIKKNNRRKANQSG